jgi:hypothetical protein
MKAPHVTSSLVQTRRKRRRAKKNKYYFDKEELLYKHGTLPGTPITMMLHPSHPSLLTGFSPPPKYYTTKVTIYSGPQYLQTILFIHIFCNYYAVDG